MESTPPKNSSQAVKHVVEITAQYKKRTFSLNYYSKVK